jgi:hypothetical protein
MIHVIDVREGSERRAEDAGETHRSFFGKQKHQPKTQENVQLIIDHRRTKTGKSQSKRMNLALVYR